MLTCFCPSILAILPSMEKGEVGLDLESLARSEIPATPLNRNRKSDCADRIKAFYDEPPPLPPETPLRQHKQRCGHAQRQASSHSIVIPLVSASSQFSIGGLATHPTDKRIIHASKKLDPSSPIAWIRFLISRPQGIASR
jgi:hypothetical protein